MEDIPPSYNSINPNVLELLPPYLETASLVNLCLVSRFYCEIFIPHLWGNPASHFVPLTGDSPNGAQSTDPANIEVTSSNNDMVYVALTRFKRTLRRARLSTRMLCHTLHLPPALSEIYGGPNVTWLREVLEKLPALQSLCVSGLPFFDHHSLVAVDRPRQSSMNNNSGTDEYHTYPTKMLLAMKELNATSIGLATFLPHLPNLVYLDLSYTTPARDINVLQSFGTLYDLQVLKLRGVGLRDAEAEVLANAIGLRVRLLDVAENLLTDMGIRSILQACFLLPSAQAQSQNGTSQPPYSLTNMNGNNYSRRHLESWPVGLPPSPDFLSLDTIRTVDLDNALMTQLTNPLTGRLAFEDIPHSGITHLYLSGNHRLSVEGIRSILDLGRLHVLDAGRIGALMAIDLQALRARRRSNSKSISKAKGFAAGMNSFRGLKHRARSPSSSSHNLDVSGFPEEEEEDSLDDMKFPGAEKLVPVLWEKASLNLTHLRIDHTLATSELDPTKDHTEHEKGITEKVELPGSLSTTSELDSTSRTFVEAPASNHYAVEMPSDPTVFELDSTPAQPRVELPGDIIHFALSPPVGEPPTSSAEEAIPMPIRADGAFAPELVATTENGQQDESDEEVILDASGSGIKRKKIDGAQSINTIMSPVQIPAPLQPNKKRESLCKVSPLKTDHLPPSLHDRQLRIDSLMSLRPQRPITRLHPSALPNLRTLILTNVPTEIPDSSRKILDNLKRFIAACAAEAHLAILKARTNYSLPPGRARHDAEREHAKTLFALRTIILEMGTEQDQGQQRDWKPTQQRLHFSKSSTGDMDSEALWTAAENDFSFFGEEGEEHDECGVYDQEPDKYFPTALLDDKIAVTSSGEESTMSSGQSYLSQQRSLRSPVVEAGPISPHTSSYGGTLSPVSPMMGRQGTLFHSPRDLPLLKNRRSSNEHHRHPQMSNLRDLPERPSSTGAIEMPGTIPTSRSLPPTSNPNIQVLEPPQMLDVISELAKWRKERKAAYEQEFMRQRRHNSDLTISTSMAASEIYVEGYWKGEVKVVRNSKEASKNKGRMARTGNVDIYGNYFEGGYLYR